MEEKLLHYNNIKAMLKVIARKERSGPFYKGMLKEVIELVDLCAKIAEDGMDDEIEARIYEILS